MSRDASVAALIAAAVGGRTRTVFTTSFGLEDQVLTHLIVRAGVAASMRFATLDTGRLFPETYELWEETEARYGIVVAGFSPEAARTEQLVAAQGINGFRSSIAARKLCCATRKLEPLERALAGASLWITGLRAGQSQARAGLGLHDYDAERGLAKLSPLHDWSRAEVAAFAAAHGVPVSKLHAQGFLSIGCAPCTRAVAAGEPERAGRWWWEQEESGTAAKECGLHVGADGRLMRAPASAPA